MADLFRMRDFPVREDIIPHREMDSKDSLGAYASPIPATVLVVDDDESVRELMAQVLESDGHRVIRARHSRDALILAGEYSGIIHLLLTDIRMDPFPDGFTLARALQGERPGIRVLYASGFVDQNQLQNELAVSSARFLAKPFSPTTLAATVRGLLTQPASIPA